MSREWEGVSESMIQEDRIIGSIEESMLVRMREIFWSLFCLLRMKGILISIFFIEWNMRINKKKNNNKDFWSKLFNSFSISDSIF